MLRHTRVRQKRRFARQPPFTVKPAVPLPKLVARQPPVVPPLPLQRAKDGSGTDRKRADIRRAGNQTAVSHFCVRLRPHKHPYLRCVGAVPPYLRLRLKKKFKRNVAPPKRERPELERRPFKGYRPYSERTACPSVVHKRNRQVLLWPLLHFVARP